MYVLELTMMKWHWMIYKSFLQKPKLHIKLLKKCCIIIFVLTFKQYQFQYIHVHVHIMFLQRCNLSLNLWWFFLINMRGIYALPCTCMHYHMNKFTEHWTSRIFVCGPPCQCNDAHFTIVQVRHYLERQPENTPYWWYYTPGQHLLILQTS